MSKSSSYWIEAEVTLKYILLVETSNPERTEPFAKEIITKNIEKEGTDFETVKIKDIKIIDVTKEADYGG